MVAKRRMIIVGAAIQFAAGDTLPDAAPLLEEERYAGAPTLTLNADHPLFVHRASTGTAFSANDHPIDSRQVELPEIFEERLNGEERQ
jgi:hypothetical protein